MTDIVERLRSDSSTHPDELRVLAAAEIERLRGELEGRDTVERHLNVELRAALDESERLRAKLELALIEAQNPGIDMEQVKRIRRLNREGVPNENPKWAVVNDVRNEPTWREQ